MSTQEPLPPENNPQEPQANVQQAEKEEQFTPQEQQAYNKMMSTLSQMHTKIEKVKKKLHSEPGNNQKKNKTDQMTNKLIQSKESSEIITKENLLTDITQSYEKVVIDVYSQNGKLKKKIEEMTRLIKDQNNKIYAHTQKERDLINQNEALRSEIAKLKDEKLMLARGHQPIHNAQRETAKEESTKKKASQVPNNQNEDFDFWSMPQNEYGKKKKDFVQDSNLWVNQKEVHDSVFLTEQQSGGKRKK